MQGIITSCHDLSDGGLGIALAECCFSGGFGAEIHLNRLLCDDVDREDFALFSESLCRMLVSVSENNRVAFESTMNQFSCSRIGTVTSEERLRVMGFADQEVLNLDIWDLKKMWQLPLGI
jgi:phosphoribosylformylglycinamidine synthase subunit PurSL